ncbi:Protein Y37H2A.10 a [Aphelenchoides avenae]|nr:Protein Y37H2A.10 a [Aphelenchus avenae]
MTVVASKTLLLISIFHACVQTKVSACAATRPSNPPTGTRCGTCSMITVRRNDNNSRPITQTPGTGSDGCPTFTINCTGTATDAAVIFTYYDANGMDIGSTFGTGTVSAVLTCNASNQLLLQGGIVNEVECISA